MEAPRPVTRRQFITGPAALRDDGLPADVGAHATQRRANSPYLVRYARQAMATDFQVFLIAGQDEHAADAALAALDVVDEVETELTVYRDTSAVLELNRRAFHEPVVVDPRLFSLLERAVELHRATDGAFDITAGPLSKAWGFSRRQGRIPDDEELSAARAAVGAQNLQLDATTRTVRFLRPDTEVNFNSVGKGFALDRCREVLSQCGVADFLLHGGQSSVLAGGSPGSDAGDAPSGGWTVGIGHPLRPEQRLAELYVAEQAVGTSGAGFQFFRHGGKRYGHILDPRTGFPAEGVFSVSVIAATAADADALSTAFYVMGCAAAERYCADHPEVGFLMLLPGAGGGTIELVTCNLNDDCLRIVS